MAGYTVYSDPAFTPATEAARQTQRQQGYHLLETYRHNPPGFWTDNKYEESQHDRGVVYIAVRAIMDVMYCATVSLGRRKRHRGKVTQLGNGTITKSVPMQQSGSAENQEYTPVHDHPICRRIEQPNPVDTFGQLLSYLVLQNRLTGVAPLWAVPNEDGKPLELYSLPTALTTPMWQRTPEYPEGAWRVQPYYSAGGLGYLPSPYAGTGVIVPNGEIMRFMDPHPLFRWDGKSPLSSGSFQLDVLEMIDQARWAAFDHGVTMDAVLQVDGFDDNQISRLEAKMEQKHQGVQNHRRFMVLSGALGTEKMRLQTFSQSPREMDFNQSWEQMTAFVLALFGVPKSVAGLAETSSYSELYAALRQFYQRQKAFSFRLAEFFTKVLCWPYCEFPGEYRVSIDLPALDDPDLLEKQLATDAGNGTILYNEYRKARNRDPVPEGDLPVPVYLARIQQKFAADEAEPQLPSGAPDIAAASPAATNGQGGGEPGSDKAGPTAGQAPQPENPLSEGSRLPNQPGASGTPGAAKAMSAYASGLGAELVRPAGLAVKKQKRKKARRAVSRLLKGL